MDMVFQFESLSDFISMSGHGPYVWFSYAIVLFAMLFFGFKPNWQMKQFVKTQSKINRQQQHQEELKKQKAQQQSQQQ